MGRSDWLRAACATNNMIARTNHITAAVATIRIGIPGRHNLLCLAHHFDTSLDTSHSLILAAVGGLGVVFGVVVSLPSNVG